MRVIVSCVGAIIVFFLCCKTSPAIVKSNATEVNSDSIEAMLQSMKKMQNLMLDSMKAKEDQVQIMLDSMKDNQDSIEARLAEMEKELRILQRMKQESVVEDQAQNMLESIKFKQDSIDTRLAEQEKEKPYLSICAYKESMHKTYEKENLYISFDSFHLATNIEKGGLDTCSGEFLFEVSGTYSVSWNFLKVEGTKVVLWKTPGGKVAHTQTSQGRSVILDMKKGETLRLVDIENEGLRELTFCISLLHAHEVKDKESEIKILPKTGQLITYNIQLSGKHDDLSQSIAEQFQQNRRNDSLVCEYNHPRWCKESCKSSGEKRCPTGCAFDFDTLGSCRDWPYGYGTDDGVNNTINPCFFLYFAPERYWDPKKYPTRKKSDHCLENLLNREEYQDNYWKDVLKITCDAEIKDEKPDLYAQLLGFSKDLMELEDGALKPYIIMALQNFTNDRTLFDELLNLGDQLDELILAGYTFEDFAQRKEFKKWWDKYHTSLDLDEKNKLENFFYPEYFSFINEWKRELRRLHKIEQESVLRNLENFKKNIYEYEYDDDKESALKKLESILCSKNSYDCRLWNIIRAFLFNRSHIFTSSYSSYSKDCPFYWKWLGYFFDAPTLLENLNTGEFKSSPSDIISEIKEEQARDREMYSRLSLFSDDKKAAMFIKYSEDNLMYAFHEIKHLISVMQDEKTRIGVTFYPETQTIPRKFFPMTGDEEKAYVAIKLHLQEKQGLAPGQEILVRCKAWYRDVEHEEGGTGMVDFKIKLE